MSTPESIRLPPHSVEAEESVLGSILVDKEALDLVMDLITPEDFYREVHRRVYTAMLELRAADEAVDITTLAARLHHSKQLEQSGGVHFLIELSNRVPSATNVKSYAQLVRDNAILRRFIELSTEASEQAYTVVEKVADFVDEHSQQLFSLSRQESRAPYFSMREVVQSTFQHIESLYERKQKITGVPSGFLDLDEMSSGFQPGDLVILAARPSMGKTALALNFLANASIDAQVPSIFFSLEMSKEQLATRLLCARSRIDASRIREGALVEAEWGRLIEGVGLLSQAPIFIDDTAALPVMKMQAKARRLKAEHNIGLIVVDYLQLMKGDEKSASREQMISDISRNLKAIAKELELPVIALSQLNRGVDSRTDKRPMLSDLRESGAIEQDADLIMFIYRDEVYNKDTQAKGIAEVIVAKQRNGPIGKVNLKWFGQFTLFENLAKGYENGPF